MELFKRVKILKKSRNCIKKLEFLEKWEFKKKKVEILKKVGILKKSRNFKIVEIFFKKSDFRKKSRNFTKIQRVGILEKESEF